MNPEAAHLANFPELESLKFDGNFRECSSRSPNSEWWSLVPAVIREGQLPMCLHSRVRSAGMQVGQQSFGGHVDASQPWPTAGVSWVPGVQQTHAPVLLCGVSGLLVCRAAQGLVQPARAKQSMVQGWHQQGPELLCRPTGRTHHTVVGVQVVLTHHVVPAWRTSRAC